MERKDPSSEISRRAPAFYRLMAMTQRWLPDLRSLLDQAVVIRHPVIPHQVLAKEQDANKLSTLNEDFRLPYPTTAIEDRASCVVLADLHPHQRGTQSARLYIDCCPGDWLTSEESYNDTFEEMLACRDIAQHLPEGFCSVSIGTIRATIHSQTRWQVEGTLDHSIAGTVDSLLIPPGVIPALPEQALQPMREVALRNAMTAIEEIIHIEGLPKFTRWPAVAEQVERSTGPRAVFRISENGSIEFI